MAFRRSIFWFFRCWFFCCALLACAESSGPAGSDFRNDAGIDANLPNADSSFQESGTGDVGVPESDPATPDAAARCLGGPKPDPRLPGTRDPDLLARAAVVVGSCIEDDGIDRNLANMWHSDVDHAWMWQRTSLQAECLAAARCGCGAVKACIGWEVTPSDGGSCEPCSGSKLSACGANEAGARVDVDCGALGLICDPLMGCSEERATPCDRATFVPTCDAKGRPEFCSQKSLQGGSTHRGSPCDDLGLACSAGRCVGTGETCVGGDPGPEGQLSLKGVGCAGTQLDACVGGRRQLIDCAARGPGFSCQSFGGAYFCGLASECRPGNEPFAPTHHTTCDGSTVIVCNAGRLDRIDCLSLGFSDCEIDKSKRRYGCTPGPFDPATSRPRDRPAPR